MSVMDFVRGSVIAFLIGTPTMLVSILFDSNSTFLILLYWVVILVLIYKNLVKRHFAFAIGLFFGPMIIWAIIVSLLVMLLPS